VPHLLVVLVFPDRTFANTRYKLLARVGGAQTISCSLIRHVQTRSRAAAWCRGQEIVNIAAIAVVDALFHGYVREIDALQKKVLIVDDFPSEVRLVRT
jgi:hypothetical protein